MSGDQKAGELHHYSALSECIWQRTVRVQGLKSESAASAVHRAGGLGRHPELTFKPSSAQAKYFLPMTLFQLTIAAVKLTSIKINSV